MSKYCSNCGKELQENAKFCPDCGTKTGQDDTVNQNQQVNMESQVFNQQNVQGNIKKPKRKFGCLTFIIAIFIFFGITAIVFLGAIGQNAAIQKEVSGVSDSSEYITLEEYNQIESGMSYEEVQEIVGSAGEVSVQSSGNGIQITMVTWYGNGTAGSNANVTFTNNEVTAKAQIGLK